MKYKLHNKLDCYIDLTEVISLSIESDNIINIDICLYLKKWFNDKMVYFYI